MLKLKILNTSSCVAIFILFNNILNNIKKNYFPFTQLHTKEQVNILLYGYLSNKSNAFNQGIIKIIINFLQKSDRFDKPLISFNQCFYVLLFLFLPIFLFYVITSLLENNCKFAACNWLKIFLTHFF